MSRLGFGVLGLLATVVTQETWGRAEREAVALLEQQVTGKPAPGTARTAIASVNPA